MKENTGQKLLIIVDKASSKNKLSKLANHSRGWPEGSLSNSYYTKV